jgi:DNA polymerase III epsilon subunit-like protein
MVTSLPWRGNNLTESTYFSCYNLSMINTPFASEYYVSVDVETSGPYPGGYSLLSIGACTLFQPRATFYAELKPINDNVIPEAMQIHRLSLGQLFEHGEEPSLALERFADWLTNHAPQGQPPVFVAFNAVFDWMFLSYYFHHFLRRNPFGHAALDIKAYYMGKFGISWAETSMRYLSPRFLSDQPLSHHALRDAMDQADLFIKIMEASNGKG